MTVLTRQDICDWWNSYGKEQSVHINSDHPLWIPENIPGLRCEYFVRVSPIRTEWVGRYVKQTYWDWVETNLKGNIRCFASASDEGWEIWGFDNKDDIVLWMLRWA